MNSSIRQTEHRIPHIDNASTLADINIESLKMIDIDNLKQAEIDKLFGALNTTQDLRLRMGIFIGSVNLAAVGSGFTYNKPFLILIAACLIPIFVCADILLLQNIFSYYYRGKRILRAINYDSVNFFDMFMQIFSSDLRKTIEELVNMENEDFALEKLRRLPRKPTLMGFWGPLMILVSEIIVGVVLPKYPCYNVK
jgi:hypothetical protein